MSLFDGYLMVDWSAAGTPRTGKDSIWIAFLADGELRLENPATRVTAEALIAEMVEGFAGRVLVGFDFPFGYPEGTAAGLTGVDDWRVLWSFLETLVIEGEKNTNNRFVVASDLNARFDGLGPFYGNGLKDDIVGLPRTKPDGYDVVYPARKRLAERDVPGTQEVWKLIGAGSVGSQALVGIPVVERLRHRLKASVWPFEECLNGHVLAEIFPSVLEPHPDEPVRDAGQVRAMVEALAEIDAAGRLGAFLDAPKAMPEAVRREEACILGMGVEGGLAGALSGEVSGDVTQKPTHAPAPSKPARVMRYERDPAEIYRQSFATVEKEARLDRFPEAMRPLVIRLIHACGMVDVADRVAFSTRAMEAGRAALHAGRPVLCDCEMVRSGIIARNLSAKNALICTLNDASVRARASEIGNTRSAAAVELWGDDLDGAIVAVGNAPTALFHLLELMDRGGPKPALILGFPVGFVGAAESKAELAARPRGCEYIALRGRRGGSAMASAAVNALAAGLEGGL